MKNNECEIEEYEQVNDSIFYFYSEQQFYAS